MATNRRPRVRVSAVGLWLSCTALATLALYRLDWIGWERAALNILWAGVITFSLIWAVAVLRPRPTPPPTATLPPAGTYSSTFVPPNEPGIERELDAASHSASHWVPPRKEPPPAREAGPARRRYEARRRRIPIVARERRKRVV